MADPAAEARIRDLKRRLKLEPGSRLFVALADEYRRAGRLAEALSTLQRGLLVHPHYLSAQVALGRAYLEAGQVTEAIATFLKVLVADPGNLVSAKSLGDIYLSRGENVEAIKKYKLYRALSGDRGVEEIIRQLEKELAPPPPSVSLSEAAVGVPPPPAFVEKPTEPIRLSRAVGKQEELRPAESDPFDITSVTFERIEGSSQPQEEEPFAVLSRDQPLVIPPLRAAPSPPADADLATRAIRVSELLGEPPGSVALEPQRNPAASGEPAPASPEPGGRTLADLYFAQGHYAEALRIYDDLVASNPFDEELNRMRRDAEARLLPAATTPGSRGADTALERRLAKIRALKRWLSVVQAG